MRLLKGVDCVLNQKSRHVPEQRGDSAAATSGRILARFFVSEEARNCASIAAPGSAMLALRFAATTMGCSISAEACTITEAGSCACTGDSGLCSDTPSSRGAAAAAVQSDSCNFGTPTAGVAQCSKCVPRHECRNTAPVPRHLCQHT